MTGGHSDIVWWVEFINDDTQAISCCFDKTTRIWDAALGRQVCQRAGQHLTLVEGLSDENTRIRHILTARNDTLLIYDFAQERQHVQGGAAAAPAACFKAPQPITAMRCHGVAICVGCDRGAVCLLSAPFLTA
jgi:hypothetical protein